MGHSDLSLKLKQRENIDKLMISLVTNQGLWRNLPMTKSAIDNLIVMAINERHAGKYIADELDNEWNPILKLGYQMGSRPWEAIIAFYVWPEYLYLLDCDYKEVEMLAKIGNPVFTHYLHSIKILGTYKG